MSRPSELGLRATLVVAAAFAVFSGLDQALGGLATLGWLGQPIYFEVSNPRCTASWTITSGFWAGCGPGWG